MKNLLGLLSVVFLAANLNATEFNIVTTDYPPFQIEKNENVEGIVTDIVKGTLAGTKHTGVFKIYPWARAYQMAQKNPHVLIYSIARNAEREKLFKWIGTVAPFQIYFWKLKSRDDVKIKTLEGAKHYVVGGVYDDIKGMYLQKKGFEVGKNLALVSNDELNINKLYAKRIDLMPFDQYSFPEKVKRAGYDIHKFEKLIKIDELSNDLYLAASLDTPDSVILELQKSLEHFKLTKKYKQITLSLGN